MIRTLKKLSIVIFYSGITLFVLLVVYSIFGNGDSGNTAETAPPTGIACTRTEPYKLAPEFERVVSLILQRYQQSKSPQYDKLAGMRNCLDIQYAQFNDRGVEGVFYFDKALSNPQRLLIEVDKKYAITDDLTTAMLLSHEISHARQYVEEITDNTIWQCFDAEVDAFYSQMLFGAMLNDEEGKSIVSRIERGTNNVQLQEYKHLIELSWDVIMACGGSQRGNPSSEYVSCYKSGLYKAIREEIVANPYYQEQCK